MVCTLVLLVHDQFILVPGHTEESSLSIGYWDIEATNPGQSPGQCEPMYKQRWNKITERVHCIINQSRHTVRVAIVTILATL